MTQYFLDSSALVKRYVVESGTPWVVDLVEGDGHLLVSRLTLVELTATVVRRARAGDLSADDLAVVLEVVENEFRTRYDVIEVGGAVVSRALDVVRAHGLRAADAIQLACALTAFGASSASTETAVVSSDQELNAAAEKEGLRVMDPQAQ